MEMGGNNRYPYKTGITAGWNEGPAEPQVGGHSRRTARRTTPSCSTYVLSSRLPFLPPVFPFHLPLPVLFPSPILSPLPLPLPPPTLYPCPSPSLTPYPFTSPSPPCPFPSSFPFPFPPAFPFPFRFYFPFPAHAPALPPPLSPPSSFSLSAPRRGSGPAPCRYRSSADRKLTPLFSPWYCDYSLRIELASRLSPPDAVSVTHSTRRRPLRRRPPRLKIEETGRKDSGANPLSVHSQEITANTKRYLWKIWMLGKSSSPLWSFCCR